MPFLNVRECRYFYQEGGGEGKAGVVVFAHGFLMDSDMWRYQFELIESKFRDKLKYIAFDWRGQGRSEATENGYDMEELYLDALSILDELGCEPEKTVWVGLSMGGFIGMRIAARNPDRIKGLVLADTGAGGENPLKRIKWTGFTLIFRLFGSKPLEKAIAKTLFSLHSLDKPFVKEYMEKWRGLNKNSTVKTAMSIFRRKDVRDELKNIKIPTLILVGEDDVARPPSESEELSRLIQGSELHIIPRAGHSAPLENPEDFNTHLENFLRRVLSLD